MLMRLASFGVITWICAAVDLDHFAVAAELEDARALEALGHVLEVESSVLSTSDLMPFCPRGLPPSLPRIRGCSSRS